jgi:glycosyltransferase involved in cell wall biosynthesis
MMNDSPLISIITVVFNGSKTLKQTIDSVLSQNYKNIEYIIIDGGSTDGTLDIIKKHEEYITEWISEPDKGLYDAMNKGISKANGEIIGMINSDDWYELNTVELIVEAYRKNPEKKIFHGDIFEILENGIKRIRRFNPSKFKFLYYAMTYNHPTMFVHKDVYKIHLYNNNLKSHSDYQFVLEAFLRDRSQFNYLSIPLSNFRLGGVSAQMNFWEVSKALFNIRRNSGFSIYSVVFSFLLMSAVKTYTRLLFCIKQKNR